MIAREKNQAIYYSLSPPVCLRSPFTPLVQQPQPILRTSPQSPPLRPPQNPLYNIVYPPRNKTSEKRPKVNQNSHFLQVAKLNRKCIFCSSPPPLIFSLFACLYVYIPTYTINMSVLGNTCVRIGLFVPNLALICQRSDSPNERPKKFLPQYINNYTIK